MERVSPCTDCGDLILPATIEKNKGRCFPCLQAHIFKEENWPHRIAFWAAALLLLINAAFTVFEMSQDGSSSLHVASLVIDVVLALFLLQEEEIARLGTLVWAAFGLIVPMVVRAMDSSMPGSVLETGISQLLFCGALILLMGWKTERIRLCLATVMGVFYSLYLSVIVAALLY